MTWLDFKWRSTSSSNNWHLPHLCVPSLVLWNQSKGEKRPRRISTSPWLGREGHDLSVLQKDFKCSVLNCGLPVILKTFENQWELSWPAHTKWSSVREVNQPIAPIKLMISHFQVLKKVCDRRITASVLQCMEGKRIRGIYYYCF